MSITWLDRILFGKAGLQRAQEASVRYEKACAARESIEKAAARAEVEFREAVEAAVAQSKAVASIPPPPPAHLPVPLAEAVRELGGIDEEDDEIEAHHDAPPARGSR